MARRISSSRTATAPAVLSAPTISAKSRPRDGTVAGYLTAAAWNYVVDPAAYRIDFGTFEFIAYQPANIVYFVRTDTPPGVKDGASLLQTSGLVAGGLAADSSKDLKIRLSLDILGVPYKYVTGFRSAAPARLALQRGEINFFSESSPSYFGVDRAGAGEDRRRRFRSGTTRSTTARHSRRSSRWTTRGSRAILDFYRKTKGTPPSGLKLGRLPHQPRRRCRHAAHDRLAAGRAGWRRQCAARRDRASQRRCGVCQGGAQGAAVRAAIRHQRQSECAGPTQSRGESRRSGSSWPSSSRTRRNRRGRSDGVSPRRSETAMAALAVAMLATGVEANEPFYKGKRLSVLINYGAGGPADIEGRLFARHIGRHIDGNPSVIAQNIDGAGGLVGTTYLGEIAPKDGTMMGHLTGAAWRWAFDPERFRVDFNTYEFLGYQTSTTVAFVRTDVAARHQGRDRHRQGEGADFRRARSGQCQGPGDPALASICSAFRTGTSPAIAAARMRGWRCSRARSISIRNRRRAIAPWCIPASSRRVWRCRSGTRRNGGGTRREAGRRSRHRAVPRGVPGREGQAAGRPVVGRLQDHQDHQRHHDPHSRAAAGRAAAGGRGFAGRRWCG